MKKVGYISEKVIVTLGLSITPNTPIYIGQQNIDHINSNHPHDFYYYGDYLEDILKIPDYIGFSKKNNSIEYIKKVSIDPNVSIIIAVRVSSSGNFFVRTFYNISDDSIHRRLAKGTLFRA